MLKKFFNSFNKKGSVIIPSSDINERIDNIFDSLDKHVINIQIGSDLIDYKQLIFDTIFEVRREIKEECGFIIPAVNIQDNYFVQENELIIYIQEKPFINTFLIPNETAIKEEFYEVFKSCMYDSLKAVFTNEITEKYIYAVQKNNYLLIWNLTNILSTIDIKTILVDIILKGKSISNINYVFEKIGEEVLNNGEFRDFLKKYNPHYIAKEVVKNLD